MKSAQNCANLRANLRCACTNPSIPSTFSIRLMGTNDLLAIARGSPTATFPPNGQAL
jgi:hypothetical protein